MQSDSDGYKSEVLIVVCLQVAGSDNSLLQEGMPMQNNTIVQQIDPPILAPVKMGEVVSCMRSDGSVCSLVIQFLVVCC